MVVGRVNIMEVVAQAIREVVTEQHMATAPAYMAREPEASRALTGVWLVEVVASAFPLDPNTALFYLKYS